VSGIVLFFLYRYLIDHLGLEILGLWSVVLASTSIARLSDLGLSGSVIKFVARYHALKDGVQTSNVIQTAAISISVLMAVLIIIIYPLLDDLLALVIPEKMMPNVIDILPFAVLSLWLSSVGGVFQSGLDGCQRMDIRNIIMIISNILYLVLVMVLVPAYGLVGLAVSQVIQGFLVLMISWFVLRMNIRSLPFVPVYWSVSKFKEMFSYALNFQVNSVAVMFFGPATKFLMSYFGGLVMVGYYEMANQVVLRLRSLLISGNEAVSPAVAEMHEVTPEDVSQLYVKSYRILFFLAVPFYAAMLVALPVVSELWLGKVEPEFIWFGLILGVGYGVCNLVGPAYFVNLGTGDLTWNSVSHVLMAFLNLVFGYIFGLQFGAIGVICGSMLAMVLSSWFVLVPVHKRFNLMLSYLYPKEHAKLLFFSLCSPLFPIWVVLSNSVYKESLMLQISVFVLYLLLISILLWIHPYKNILMYKK